MLRYILILNLIVSIPLFCSEKILSEGKLLQSALQKGILNDSNNEVENAIKMGAKINFEKSSQSPLLRAVLLKKFNATTTLLNAGSNPNITYRDEKVIHYLIKKGAFTIANDFINANADFSGIIEGEQDAFTYSSIQSQKTQPHFDLMYSMIKKGYDFKDNFENKNLLNNAWYLALKNGDYKNIRFFLSWRYNLKNYSDELNYTANCNQIFINQDTTTWTPLLITIKWYAEHTQKTKPLEIESPILSFMSCKKLDPNKKAKPLIDKPEQNPISFCLLLSESIGDKAANIIKWLQGKGGRITEGFKIFIEGGGNPDHIIKNDEQSDQNFSVSLLSMAIEFDDIEAVKFLISKNVDINLNINPFPLPPQKDDNQLSKPLSKSLLKYKDPYERVRGLHKPLFFALHKEVDLSIAELLIENGAEI